MNKHTLACASFLIMLLGITYHSVTSASDESATTISAQELKYLIDHDIDVTIIDIHDPFDYNDCHITGAINIPSNELEQKSNTIVDIKKTVIVYGASYSDTSAQDAFDFLNQSGFNVRLYRGGIKEFKAFGFPIEGPCKMDYLKYTK